MVAVCDSWSEQASAIMDFENPYFFLPAIMLERQMTIWGQRSVDAELANKTDVLALVEAELKLIAEAWEN